ncbi:MAG: DUF6807 family protein [Planctomycetia bacterium]
MNSKRIVIGLCLACSSLALGAGQAAVAAPGLGIRVEAGTVDRSGLPVRAGVTASAAEHCGRDGVVRLKLPDGSHVIGQVVPRGLLAPTSAAPDATTGSDVVFVLPTVAAGTAVDLVAEPAATADAAPRLEWHDRDHAAELTSGGRPLLRYEMPAYDPSSESVRVKTYKPFHHVFDAESGTQLTKGDGGGYTHHRGIFFGYNRITHGPDRGRTSDCWHCSGRSRQEHRRVLEQAGGPVAGVQRVAIDWIGSEGMRILGEIREIDAVPVAAGTVIDFSSRLASEEPVRLDGDPQHAGVHFRASNEVHDATKSQTYYLRPGTKAAPGDYRNWPADKTYVDAPWHAGSFVVGGRRFTVLRVNRPANPGEARMSERDYGRFGSYFEYDLMADRPLEVGYRFWVQPGEMTLDDAARIAADYAVPAKVTVRE